MKSLKNFHELLNNRGIVKNKLVFLVAMACFSTYSWSQVGTSYGIKAGLNYNGNGNYIESIGSTSENPDKNIGYHIGVFGKIGNSVYFRPELVYTSTKSDYDSGDFNMKKLDVPLLIGVKVIGPISVFGGPAFQYILDTDFDNISINNVENDFTVGLNFGAAVNFNKFAVDVRYERGLSNNEASFLDNNRVDIDNRLDTRPDQLILSLSIIL